MQGFISPNLQVASKSTTAVARVVIGGRLLPVRCVSPNPQKASLLSSTYGTGYLTKIKRPFPGERSLI